MKSLQFRSIAPKAPAPAVVPPSPALLSCQQQPPEASTAGGGAAKSIIVPAQNYALMQVAGQEGTFSLVALPPAVNPQTPPQQQHQQQHQQQAQPIQKNLKLPIPRYQPMRSKGTPEKARSAPAAAVVKAKSPTKVAVTTRARSLAATKRRPPEAKEAREMKAEPPEQVMLVDPSAGEVPVAAPLLPDSAVVYPERGASAVDGSPALRGLLPNPHYSSTAAARNSPATAAQEEAKAAPGSITVLSPAIFSKAVQIIPSPPKGKLPILPYSKVKGTLVPAARLPPASPSEPLSETADALRGGRPPPPSQPRAKAAPPPPPSLGALQKPPAKKRGRKRKTPEDILAFEARKKRSLSFFRRRVPEKPPAAASTAGAAPRSEQWEVDISKKYRSIRPKPVLLMDTLPRLVGLPPLAPAADGAVPHSLPPPLHHFRAGPQRAYPLTGGLGTGGGGGGGAGRAGSHRCSVCGRCFRFKHHLQSHVNSHANGRPHACPVCRKAYAHSGSLSTHMKLRHGEGRPRPWRRTLRCEFCDKAFGYVGVYFGHLREVHRVVLTVEPSISQHEDRGPADGAMSPDSSDEHGQEEREDPVELQIKCGRCQATTPTFADMKLHLLYVHSEEVRTGPRDGAARGGREAEDELVKHAAHYWRQLNERRNPVKCGSCDEEFFSFSKLKRHILSQHPGEPDDGESGESAGETAAAGGAGGGRRSRQGVGPLWAGAGYNCVLCSQVLDSRDEVMDHWRGRHHCEQPGVLWEALSSCSAQGEAEVETESDTPAHSPSH